MKKFGHRNENRWWIRTHLCLNFLKCSSHWTQLKSEFKFKNPNLFQIRIFNKHNDSTHLLRTISHPQLHRPRKSTYTNMISFRLLLRMSISSNPQHLISLKVRLYRHQRNLKNTSIWLMMKQCNSKVIILKTLFQVVLK